MEHVRDLGRGRVLRLSVGQNCNPHSIQVHGTVLIATYVHPISYAVSSFCVVGLPREFGSWQSMRKCTLPSMQGLAQVSGGAESWLQQLRLS